MKKVLSVVLVLAMVLGSVAMVFAANNTFADDTAITNKEASAVLASAGIIEGYTDGTFKPAGILTRAEGAAIAARLVLGKADAAKLTTVVGPFNDVPASHWAAGYISYCAAQGYLNGYGNGNFGPEDTLTVAQFGKMMLTLLGYKSENEGFVGDAWETNVGSVMVKAGLTDGVTLSGSNACSREVAAQVALNTLKGELVKYEGTPTTVSTGSVTVTTGQSSAKKDDWQSGDKTTYKSETKANGNPRFMNRYQKDLVLNPTVADAFGRPDTNKWTYKGTSVYTAKSNSNLAASYTNKQTYKTLYQLLNDRDALDAGNTIEVIQNGSDVTATVLGGTGAAAVNNLKTTYKTSTTNFINENGIQIEVFYDSSAKKATVVAYSYLLVKATADYSASKESVKIKWVSAQPAGTPTEILKKDFAVEGVKEDDYLIVTAAGGEIKSCAPATKVTGTISKYTVDSNVTVDGTQYTKSKQFDSSVTTPFEDLTAGTELTLVLDPNNFVLATTDEVSSSQFVFVADAGRTSTLGDTVYEAIVYFVDGTRQTVKVDAVADMTVLCGGTAPAGNAGSDTNFKAGWYNYAVKKNGNYTFTASTKTEAQNTVTSIKSKSIDYATGFATATSETVILVHKDGKSSATVYNGYKNLPGVTGGTIKVATVKTSATSTYAKYVFIDTVGSTVTGANTSDYLVIYKGGNPDNVVDGDDKYQAYGKTFLNGTKGTTNFSNGTIPGTVVTATIGLYTDLSYTSEGWVDGAQAFTSATPTNGYLALTGVAQSGVDFKSGTLTIQAGNVYGTADNVKAYVIDGDTVDDISLSNIKSNLEGTTYTVFVKFTDTTNDHIIDAVYFIKTA